TSAGAASSDACSLGTVSMAVTINDPGPPPTADALAAEEHLGRSIPAPYRAFLLEHNGGRHWPDAFAFVRRDDGNAHEPFRPSYVTRPGRRWSRGTVPPLPEQLRTQQQTL